jgi:hypothetical protein
MTPVNWRLDHNMMYFRLTQFVFNGVVVPMEYSWVMLGKLSSSAGVDEMSHSGLEVGLRSCAGYNSIS